MSSAHFGHMVHGEWPDIRLHGTRCTAGCYTVRGARLDATINIWPKANVTAVEKTSGL